MVKGFFYGSHMILMTSLRCHDTSTVSHGVMECHGDSFLNCV